MVRDQEIMSIILPWPARTDVRQKAKWTFDLQAPPYTRPM